MASPPAKRSTVSHDLQGHDLLNVGPVASLAAVLPAGVAPAKPLVAAALFPIAANSLPNGPSRTITDLDDLIRYLFGAAAPAPSGTARTYAETSYSTDHY